MWAVLHNCRVKSQCSYNNAIPTDWLYTFLLDSVVPNHDVGQVSCEQCLSYLLTKSSIPYIVLSIYCWWKITNIDFSSVIIIVLEGRKTRKTIFRSVLMRTQQKPLGQEFSLQDKAHFHSIYVTHQSRQWKFWLIIVSFSSLSFPPSLEQWWYTGMDHE